MIRGILRIGVVAAGEIVRTGIENKALALLATVLLTIQFLAPAVWAQSEAAQSAGDDRPVADKWALVIGIDRFQDKRIPTLRYSAKDARDFADFLVKKGNFAADHILTLINEQATYQNIEEALGDTWLPRRALSDDLVLIYVSSHGSPREMDVGKDNWLIAHNTNIDKFYSTGIELTSLAATVKKRTGCERVVVILDACNSGAAQTGGGKGLIRPANFDINSIIGDGEVVISSSDCNQRSWESKRYQNGVFTRKLIETLSGGGANRPLNEAFEELKSSVEQEVRFDRKATQTPIFKSKWKGKPLVLAAIPTHPRKSIMPALNTVPEQSTEPAPTETVAVATPDTTIVGIDKDKSTLTGQVSSEHHLLNKKLAFLSVLPPLQYKITMSPTYGVVSQKDFDGAKQFNRMIFNNVRAGLGRSLTVTESGGALWAAGDTPHLLLDPAFARGAFLNESRLESWVNVAPGALGLVLGGKTWLFLQTNEARLEPLRFWNEGAKELSIGLESPHLQRMPHMKRPDRAKGDDSPP